MNQPIRILVVDDDPDTLGGVVRLLEKTGRYAVESASNGEDALSSVQRQRPDLLLLDRDLPGIDGLEVCRQIKREEALRDIFVVMLSASYIESTEQAEGLEAGADGYVASPVGNRELLARVESYVRIATLTRSLRRQALELQKNGNDRRESQLASINLMEDAVAARDRADQAFRALSESENRYRTLVNCSPLAIFVNRNDRVVLVNDACLRLFGATAPEQLIGKSPYELFHPDFHALVRERIRQLREEGKPVSQVEERIIRVDGACVEVEVSASSFEDQEGRAIHVVLSDITARKLTEMKVAEQLAELRRWNSVTTGREGRILELKQEVNDLLTQRGQPPRYPSAIRAAADGGETQGKRGAP